MKEIKVTTSGTMKIGKIQVFEPEPRKYANKLPPQPPLTRERFMGLLMKSAQPVKLDSKAKGTSESHLSDGCSDKCTSQDKTVSKED